MTLKKSKSKSAITDPLQATLSHFPVVAIGASAGGLEAMMELLNFLPPDTGMAFIYVQHLSPDHKSMLTEILSKKTSMIVQEIDDMDKIKPNNVFVIPYNKGIEVTDGHIKLIPRSDSSAAISIDILFSSLAEAQKERVIGIILSGSASDGTIGVRAIKQEGGLTFAQDDTAKFTSMPHSAIAAGMVDFILSPKEIALELARLSKHPLIKTIGVKNGEEDLIDNRNPDLKSILNQLHKVTGVDFSAYKMNTIKRRIIRRMLLYKISSLKEYAKLLTQKNEEIGILYQDLLINVTSFFRDTDTHKYLKETLFPKLLKRKKTGESLRLWVPACSTGEEAYSIAMMLLEIQGTSTTNTPIQIFATDLSEYAIGKARIGVYTKQELETVSPKRIQRFFTKSNGGFRVNKSVRDMCVFAPHNILQDPPFSRLDFISCCNLFIYLDNAAQKKAVNTFHYALNEDGFLMLGKSENITHSANLFSGFNKKYKIFSRKINTGTRTLPALLPRYAQQTFPENNFSVTNKNKTKQTISVNHSGLDNAIDAVLVSEFMPASVVINHQMEIVQFRGTTDLFLTHPKGKATFNILKMARPEIAFELRNAISKVIKTKKSVRKSGIELKLNSAVRIISFEVVSLKIESDEPLLLILFTEQEQSEIYTQQTTSGKNNSLAKDRRIKKLEEELAAAHADALAISQEQEAFAEELQSANEEVVSSNEELQTVNEELETSKEEIESANEELTTTNQELQTRNDLLNESYDYSEAVIATMHNPMLVLDKSLRVKSASKTFYKIFKVNEEETEGVLLYDLGNRQWNIPRLRELLEDILPKNSRFFDFEITHTFPLIGEKIMLLNASRIVQKTNHEELILLAIADVTEVRRKAMELQSKEKEILLIQINAEQNLRKKIEDSEKRYNMMLMQSPFAFAVLKGKDMVIAIANDSIKQMWGKGNKIEGKPLIEILPEMKDQAFPALLYEVFTTGIPYMANESLARMKRKGKMEDVYLNFVYQPYRETDDTISGVTIIAIEVTPEAEFNKKMKASEENFRQLAELLPQKISQADATGNVFFYNQNWLSYSGLSIEELKGDGWTKIIHPDDEDEITKRWQHSVKTGSNFEMEIRLLNKKGGYKWHLSRATALKDDNGNIVKWICTAAEIQKQVEQRTELERAVENRTNELKQANEELLKMNKELEEFTYVSSHDLQEPLRKLQTFAGIILEKENQNLSENGKNYFRHMQQSAERMQQLIQDLLAFSRISAAERKFENMDLNIIIQEVKKEFKEEIAEKQAVIEVKETCEVHIIPFQFRQLMHNLIGNALKFSNPETPLHIKISCRNSKYEKLNIENLPPQKEYCHISISDNGIGFENKFSTKIFEVFQKLHGKEEYKGTGIGLAIVKKIVDNHNGIITATGKLNKGATFNIYIPILQ
jgi:two-component system CheB/CheR fusion protein